MSFPYSSHTAPPFYNFGTVQHYTLSSSPFLPPPQFQPIAVPFPIFTPPSALLQPPQFQPIAAPFPIFTSPSTLLPPPQFQPIMTPSPAVGLQNLLPPRLTYLKIPPQSSTVFDTPPHSFEAIPEAKQTEESIQKTPAWKKSDMKFSGTVKIVFLEEGYTLEKVNPEVVLETDKKSPFKRKMDWFSSAGQEACKLLYAIATEILEENQHLAEQYKTIFNLETVETDILPKLRDRLMQKGLEHKSKGNDKSAQEFFKVVETVYALTVKKHFNNYKCHHHEWHGSWWKTVNQKRESEGYLHRKRKVSGME
ncbi:MAG: hypothetical protein WCG42_04655 [Parachlamydiaceae bacterium]